MRTSRIFFVILLMVVFGTLVLTLLVPRLMFRDSTELMPQPSNVEYTRWELPEGAKARLGKGSINDIKFSPDGTRFAVATTIGVWMYDAKTGTEISLFKGKRQNIEGVAFSTDGRLVTGASSAGKILRWNADTNELRSIIGNEKISTLFSVVFSEDGTKLVSVSSPNHKIRLWNLGDGTTSPTITDINPDFKNGHLTAIALSPDKRVLATAIDAWKKVYPIQIWDADTGERLLTLKGNLRRIESLVFSPDGKTLASGEYKTTKLWDIDTTTARATFKAPTSSYALAFSPNGKLLASGGDANVRLWNAETKQEGWQGAINKFLPTLTLKGHKAGVSTLAFSPDGKILLTGSKDGTIRAWDSITGRQQFACPGHTSEISEIAISDNGNTLISVHSQKNQLLHWDINGGHHLSGYYFRNKNKRPEAISPDGKTLAIKDWWAKNTLKLWNTSKKRIKATLKGHEDSPSKIPNFEFSLDGNKLATTGTQQGITVIHLWNIPNQSQPFLKRLFFNSKTMRPIYTLKGAGSVLTFSSNGKMLASGSRDKIIRLWNVETGNALFTLTGHNKQITAIAFSPNGKSLVSASYLVIYLWNVETGQLLIKSQPMSTAKILQFSPDGKIVVSGRYDGTIQLWNARTLSLLSVHIGHTSWVNALIFLEDGKTLASASEDGTILLWDWEKIK
ncbi:MAG: WD40 repeat domain-containing protein [Candidatus Poribacteria bacterium]|nr:WD40 repeat domain-containing protein [Candidatus Poribacteria bacterium]